MIRNHCIETKIINCHQQVCTQVRVKFYKASINTLGKQLNLKILYFEKTETRKIM